MTQNKIQPPTHGPYARRAQVVIAALGALLQEAFDKRLQPVKRGSDQKLVFTWELDPHVKVVVSKASGNADPSIWVRRGDPSGSTAVDSDWRNEEFQRAYKDQSYDLTEIMGKIKAAVEYNESHATQNQENAKAMATELDGVPVSGGTEITRDPTTGFYTIRQTTVVKDVKLEKAKQVLKQINGICGAMLEKKPDPKPESNPGAKKEGVTESS